MTFACFRSRTLSRVFVAFTVVLSLSGGVADAAAPREDARIEALIETLGKTLMPTEAQISPDGSTVAWSVLTTGGSQIHLTDVTNPDPAKEKIVGTGRVLRIARARGRSGRRMGSRWRLCRTARCRLTSRGSRCLCGR